MAWLKLYYRDKEGVMRAIPGIKILPGLGSRPSSAVPTMINLDESVYTLSMKAGGKWWFDAIEGGEIE